MKMVAVPKAVSPTVQEALDLIEGHAADADAGGRTLTGDMALLADAGVLGMLCDKGIDPRRHVTLLRRIGRASLPVGRLAEGHMNAMRLIDLYGTPTQRKTHCASAASGAIYGVWGADGSPPVAVTGEDAESVTLAGQKRFASGLGTVTCAVVVAQTPKGHLLVLVGVEDALRGDPSGWQTSGMRATASGTYDFDGVAAEVLGQIGDYAREPHFEGGVWRYAALHVGGLEALAEAVRAALDTGAQQAQLHRLARMATLAHGARLLVEDAAMRVERPDAGQDAVALSLAAREAVERACLDGIAIADRALGTRAFATGEKADRTRRDLSFFLRQANLDGKLDQVAETLLQSDRPLHDIWGGM